MTAAMLLLLLLLQQQLASVHPPGPYPLAHGRAFSLQPPQLHCQCQMRPQALFVSCQQQ